MTIRERTKALTTGPGEKLRNALGLGPEHSGTCAQLARAASQYKTEYSRKPIRKLSGWAGREPDDRKLKTMEIRIAGLTESLGVGYYALINGIGGTEIVRPDSPLISV